MSDKQGEVAKRKKEEEKGVHSSQHQIFIFSTAIKSVIKWEPFHNTFEVHISLFIPII